MPAVYRQYAACCNSVGPDWWDLEFIPYCNVISRHMQKGTENVNCLLSWGR